MATPKVNEIIKDSTSTYPTTDNSTVLVNASSLRIKNVGNNTVNYRFVTANQSGTIEKDEVIPFLTSGDLINDTIEFSFLAPSSIDVTWVEGSGAVGPVEDVNVVTNQTDFSTQEQQETTNDLLSSKETAYIINLSDVETGAVTFPIVVNQLQARAGEPGSFTFETVDAAAQTFNNLNDLIDYWNAQMNYYELAYKDENSFYLLAKDEPLPNNDPNLPLGDQNFVSFNDTSTFTFRVFRSAVFKDGLFPLNDGISNLDEILSESKNIVQELQKIATPLDFFNEISEGNISGVASFSKFGQNLNLNQTQQVIASFGGSFTPLSAASTLSIVSSSVNDNGTGTTGALTVLLTGVDANRNAVTETITLNGQTPFVTSSLWFGINKAEVLTAGTSQSNEGTITIASTGGSPQTQAAIPAGTSTTKQLIFHVPNNVNAKIYSYNFSSVRATNGSTRITVKGYTLKNNVRVEFFDGQISTNGSAFIFEELKILLSLEAGTVWWFEALSDVSTGRISGRVQQTLNNL